MKTTVPTSSISPIRAQTSEAVLAEVGQAAQSRRPNSLAEVQLWGQSLGTIDGFLREFLDGFYTEPVLEKRAAMLQAEPALGQNHKANAYLAAVAEHLAMKSGLASPPWVNAPMRFLKMPYFPAGLESLKATLLVESPVAFRRRLIFVGADPLYRPRRDVQGFGNSQTQAGAFLPN